MTGSQDKHPCTRSVQIPFHQNFCSRVQNDIHRYFIYIIYNLIGSIHLSRCYHIFRGCVPEMFVTSYSVTYCICIPGNQDVFMIIAQFMIRAKSRIRFGLLILFVCLHFTPSHYHHCAILSEDIELIKCLSDTFWRVWVILSIFSLINYTLYGTVCFQFTHFPCDDWENAYTMSYYQIGGMNDYPLFMVRSWNNMVCISIFLYMYAAYANTSDGDKGNEDDEDDDDNDDDVDDDDHHIYHHHETHSCWWQRIYLKYHIKRKSLHIIQTWFKYIFCVVVQYTSHLV